MLLRVTAWLSAKAKVAGDLSANNLGLPYAVLLSCRKILELEEELKVVGNNMKSLEISEQEVPSLTSHQAFVLFACRHDKRSLACMS